ncbi:membrane-bound inhibitor of C-type lysozyme [Rhizobium sp. SLBN-94]|nr:membrane-bound inhibitor of C-type lysozyme [Rhizobium sp. SLBN-94]
MNKTVAAISVAAFSVSLATGVMAEDLVIPLPKDTTVEKVEAVYQCAADKVEAVYFNAGEVSLVRLGLKNGVTVAANVISGSGAKYQGGIYVCGRRVTRRIFTI